MVPLAAPSVNQTWKASDNFIPVHIRQATQSQQNALNLDFEDDSEEDDLSTSSMTDSEDMHEEWAISPESYSEYVMRQERLKSFFEKKQLDRMNKTPNRIPTKKPSTLTMKLRQAPSTNEARRKNSPPSHVQRSVPLMSESLWRNVKWEQEFARSRLYTVRTRSNSSNSSDHDKHSPMLFEIDDHW